MLLEDDDMLFDTSFLRGPSVSVDLSNPFNNHPMSCIGVVCHRLNTNVRGSFSAALSTGGRSYGLTALQ